MVENQTFPREKEEEITMKNKFGIIGIVLTMLALIFAGIAFAADGGSFTDRPDGSEAVRGIIFGADGGSFTPVQKSVTFGADGGSYTPDDTKRNVVYGADGGSFAEKPEGIKRYLRYGADGGS